MDQERQPRSRRHILAAAAGGLAALATQALGRPAPARAGSDGDIAIGFNNPVSAITELENSSSSDTDPIFWANHHGYGYALYGSSVNNYGVYASGWPAGVYGTSPTSDGIKGETSGAAKSGVWGNNTGDGYGVAGSTNGSHAGVWGSNGASGIGVRASSVSGNALQVEGRAHFSRSGRAFVPAGASHVDVAVGGGLGAGANVLATLQAYRAGVHVEACRRDYPSSGVVRIYLNKAASATDQTAVAWFVFG